MLRKIQTKISASFSNADERTIAIRKNVLLSAGVKFGSIIVGLLLVPLSISYVSSSEYGVWLTISSVVGWLALFDIGLGNGVRNKVSESLALNKINEAKMYVSTTYAAMISITGVLMLVFFLVNRTISWGTLLNIQSQSDENLQNLVLLVFSSFCIQFVARIVNSLLAALHRTATSDIINFLGQFSVLVAIFFSKWLYPPSLTILVFLLAVLPVVVSLSASSYLFRTHLKHISPSIHFVNANYLRSIFNLSGAFFIVQVGSLVLFQTDNFVISRVLGQIAVTEFNIAYKLFSLVMIGAVIFLTPYWGAYTDAWTKKDFVWMQRNLILIRKVWLGLSLVTIILFFVSPILYKLWVGDRVIVSHSVSLAMMIYTIVITFQSSHNYIIDGIGKIHLQMYLMIVAACLNIPLALYLAGRFGIPGVIYSNVFFMLMLSIAFYFQLNTLLFKKESEKS